MDCFYAAVEIRDNPELKEKPVAVAGSKARSVLTTCNYIARKFGLHSAMPLGQALKLCPDLVTLPVNMAKYKKVSQEIHGIFKRFTELIEPLSLDEAYLDLSESQAFGGSASLCALEIRRAIREELRLTASAGIAPNKFLAKVASDWNKPDGQFVITPQQVHSFVSDLPVKKIPGVGKVTAQKLADLKIHTCKNLRIFSEEELISSFGKMGSSFFWLCRGIDERPVEPDRLRKSISVETTFERDLYRQEDCLNQIPLLFKELLKRMLALPEPISPKAQNQRLLVKLKFSDFSATTLERRCKEISVENYRELLLEAFSRKKMPIRLIGLGIRLDPEPRTEKIETQIDLFS
jgi:DNA polymerase-4